MDNIITLGTLNIAPQPRSDAKKSIQKGAQRRMFCYTPFVLFLRRVWADRAQEEVVFTVVQVVSNYLDDSKKSITFICLMPL